MEPVEPVESSVIVSIDSVLSQDEETTSTASIENGNKDSVEQHWILKSINGYATSGEMTAILGAR